MRHLAHGHEDIREGFGMERRRRAKGGMECRRRLMNEGLLLLSVIGTQRSAMNSPSYETAPDEIRLGVSKSPISSGAVV